MIIHLGRAAFLCAALIAFTPVAQATVITFDPPGTDGPVITDSGVTFTTDAAASLYYSITPNNTYGLLSTDAFFERFYFIRADIAAGATFVSVDLGDFNQDADLLFLEVYDAADNLLASTSLLIDESFEGMKTLSLSAANIAYAIMGAMSPALGGSSVYIDNFTFISRIVPEPSSLFLALSALGAGLLFARRNRFSVA
jgi:hypothetical protein